ncbi:MAG: hypothetical protein J5I93_07530 [Pirellulaceae bacterium]|nr:hypothetical protein [Pirellulaceae bacterium]
MIRVCLGTLLLLLSARLEAQDSSIDEQVAAHLKVLEYNRNASVRRDAVRALNGLSRSPQAVVAVPALMEVIRNDPVGEIRGLAIEVVGLIKRQQNEPCPQLLVESIFSDDEDVRNHAGVYAGLFTEFEQGAVDVLLPHLDSEDPFRRGDVLMWLAIVGTKDPKVLELLRQHTGAPHFYIRHSAQCGVYKMTNNLADILPYCIETVAGTAELPADLPDDAPVEVRQAQRQRNLITIAVLGRWMDLVATYPAELEPELVRLLESESPQVRRDIITALGKAVQAIADAPSPFSLPGLTFAGENGAARDETKSALESMQEKFLRREGIEARIKRLAEDDPDVQVRAAAMKTLAIMSEARQKEPRAPQSPLVPFLIPSSHDDLPRQPNGGYRLPRDLDEKFRDGTSNTVILGEQWNQRKRQWNSRWSNDLPSPGPKD